MTTDAIVPDKNGSFASDLKKDEFEVYEDGVKQDIASITLVHGGRVFNLQAPPPPPEQEGIVLPPPRPTTDVAGRISPFFVDDLHLDFRNTGRIRDLFKRIEKNLIHDGDMFGIVSTGPSSLAIDMTYDKRRLEEAIKRISGNGLKPTDIIEGPDGAEGPSEVRYRAHVAFSTAEELLRNLEKVQNRRKAIIYVSNGYDFNPFGTRAPAKTGCSATRPAASRDRTWVDQMRRSGGSSSLTRTWPATSPSSRGPRTAPTPPSTPSTRADLSAVRISTRTSIRSNGGTTCASRRTACG